MSILAAMKADTASASGLRIRTTVPLIRRALQWGATCIRLSRERAELRQLDLRDRQDLGHSRVNTELGSPFWRK